MHLKLLLLCPNWRWLRWSDVDVPSSPPQYHPRQNVSSWSFTAVEECSCFSSHLSSSFFLFFAKMAIIVIPSSRSIHSSFQLLSSVIIICSILPFLISSSSRVGLPVLLPVFPGSLDFTFASLSSLIFIPMSRLHASFYRLELRAHELKRRMHSLRVVIIFVSSATRVMWEKMEQRTRDEEDDHEVFNENLGSGCLQVCYCNILPVAS